MRLKLLDANRIICHDHGSDLKFKSARLMVAEMASSPSKTLVVWPGKAMMAYRPSLREFSGTRPMLHARLAGGHVPLKGFRKLAWIRKAQLFNENEQLCNETMRLQMEKCNCKVDECDCAMDTRHCWMDKSLLPNGQIALIIGFV